MSAATLRLVLTALLALCCLTGPAPALALSDLEMNRTKKLLADLEAHKDFIFIRNDAEYGVRDAVAHLKYKLKQAADRLQSAEDFVDLAASGSSLSGRPYLYKTNATAEPRPLKPFLHELLKKQPRP